MNKQSFKPGDKVTAGPLKLVVVNPGPPVLVETVPGAAHYRTAYLSPESLTKGHKKPSKPAATDEPAKAEA